MKNLQLWSLIRIAFVVGSVLAWGCTNPTELPEPEDGVTDVAIEGLGFNPRSVTIQVGESVRWTNLEAFIPHTSTSGEPGDPDGLWDSGTLSSGESFTQTFDEPGEFVYYCTFHPTVPAMVGAMVIVEP